MQDAEKLTLAEARKQGNLERFIAEREAEGAAPGDAKAFNRTLASMAGKSKVAPATSKPGRSGG